MNMVIIGTGLAGAHAAQELRSQGLAGDSTLIGDEPHPPYERPPLSKGLLLGTAQPVRHWSARAATRSRPEARAPAPGRRAAPASRPTPAPARQR